MAEAAVQSAQDELSSAQTDAAQADSTLQAAQARVQELELEINQARDDARAATDDQTDVQQKIDRDNQTIADHNQLSDQVDAQAAGVQRATDFIFDQDGIPDRVDYEIKDLAETDEADDAAATAEAGSEEYAAAESAVAAGEGITRSLARLVGEYASTAFLAAQAVYILTEDYQLASTLRQLDRTDGDFRQANDELPMLQDSLARDNDLIEAAGAARVAAEDDLPDAKADVRQATDDAQTAQDAVDQAQGDLDAAQEALQECEAAHSQDPCTPPTTPPTTPPSPTTPPPSPTTPPPTPSVPVPPPPSGTPLPPNPQAGCTGDCAGTGGDPHLTTFDHAHYDFQQVGEFVAVKSSVTDLQIQIRQRPWDSSSTVVAENSAVAFKVAGHRVGVYLGASGLTTLVDGVTTAVTSPVMLSGGGSIANSLANKQEVVTWPDGSFVIIDYSGVHYLNLSISLAADQQGHVSGLFGNDDGTASNDLTTRAGVVLPYPATSAQIYGAFSASWRISQAESLFDYANGQSTATFTDLSFPSVVATVGTLQTANRTAAEAICQQEGVTVEPYLDNCVLDLALTDDLSTATSAAAAQSFSQAPGSSFDYDSTGWKYLNVATGTDQGFEATSFDDSKWSTGQAGFGTTDGVCSWNNPQQVHTSWPSSTDMLVRRHFSVPAGATTLHLAGSIDNTADIYVNGKLVSSVSSGSCQAGAISVDIPAAGLSADNVLAIRAGDGGGATYLDVQLTAS